MCSLDITGISARNPSPVKKFRGSSFPRCWVDYCSNSSDLTKMMPGQVGARQQVQGQLEDLVGDQVDLWVGGQGGPFRQSCLDGMVCQVEEKEVRELAQYLSRTWVRTPVGCLFFNFHANVLMVWWLVVISWMEQQLLAEGMASKMKVKGRSDGNQSCKGCLRSSL